jgi:hypothetical protein
MGLYADYRGSSGSVLDDFMVEEMAWNVSLGVTSDFPYKLQFHCCSIPVCLRATTAGRQHIITSSVFELGLHFCVALQLAEHAEGQCSGHV